MYKRESWAYILYRAAASAVEARVDFPITNRKVKKWIGKKRVKLWTVLKLI